jgi:hypothetical protein
MLSKALEWASVSIVATLLRNMEGRSFLKAFEIKRYVKMFCKLVSLYIGAPSGKLGGIRLPGRFERKKSISGFLSWAQRISRL